MGRKPKIPPEKTDVESLKASIAALERQEEMVDAKLKAMPPGQFIKDVALAAGAIASAKVRMLSELRQVRKNEARDIDKIPLDKLAKRLKKLTPEARKRFCDDVLGLDDESPLL